MCCLLADPSREAGPTGLEPATSGVTVRHSNRLSYGPFCPALHLYPAVAAAAPFRAGNRTRTGDLNLGKVALYQLSYARVNTCRPNAPTGSRTPLSTLKEWRPNR